MQEVVSGSAAETAGIEVSDIIIAVDDIPIKSASELRTTIGLRRSGDAVRIKLMRDGKQRTLKATLTQLQDNTVMSAEDIHPALAGAELENHTSNDPGTPTAGVLVSAVAAGSPAAQSGLRANDIITTLNRRRVGSVNELSELAADQSLLILGLRRGQRNLLLQIR